MKVVDLSIFKLEFIEIMEYIYETYDKGFEKRLSNSIENRSIVGRRKSGNNFR